MVFRRQKCFKLVTVLSVILSGSCTARTEYYLFFSEVNTFFVQPLDEKAAAIVLRRSCISGTKALLSLDYHCEAQIVL